MQFARDRAGNESFEADQRVNYKWKGHRFKTMALESGRKQGKIQKEFRSRVRSSVKTG